MMRLLYVAKYGNQEVGGVCTDHYHIVGSYSDTLVQDLGTELQTQIMGSSPI